MKKQEYKRKESMKVYDIFFPKQDENMEKPQWIKVGVLLVKENGKMRLKLDLIPTGWDGWLSVFEREENGRNQEEEPF